MHTMRVMDRNGDTLLAWHPALGTDPEPAAPDGALVLSEAEVRTRFEELVHSGYLAYSIIDRTGGELIRDFDPDAQEIVMSIPLVGG